MDGCVELLMDSESSGYDSSTVATDGYRLSLPDNLIGGLTLLLFLCPRSVCEGYSDGYYQRTSEHLLFMFSIGHLILSPKIKNEFEIRGDNCVPCTKKDHRFMRRD